MKEIVIGSGQEIYGDSIGYGYSATGYIGWAKLINNTIGGTYTNRALGHKLTTYCANISRRYLLPTRTVPVFFQAGLNDIRGGGLAAIPKIQGNIRSFLADCFLKTVVPASLLTRNGSWAALPNQYGGKAYYHGGAPLYCNSNINASLSGTFEGDNLVVGAYRTNGTTGYYQDLAISVDNGVPIILELFGNTNEQVTYDVKVLSGFGAGQHTVKIMPTTTAAHTVVDYIGTLSANMPPVFISEIPYILNWAQYGSIATQAICDAANAAIDEVLAEFSAYPIEKVCVNDYWVPATQSAADQLHPANAGHQSMSEAFLAKIKLVQFVEVPAWATKVTIVADEVETVREFDTAIVKFSQ